MRDNKGVLHIPKYLYHIIIVHFPLSVSPDNLSYPSYTPHSTYHDRHLRRRLRPPGWAGRSPPRTDQWSLW